jgi:hypothetical protein
MPCLAGIRLCSPGSLVTLGLGVTRTWMPWLGIKQFIPWSQTSNFNLIKCCWLKVTEWLKESHSKHYAATPGMRQLKLSTGSPSDVLSTDQTAFDRKLQAGNRLLPGHCTLRWHLPLQASWKAPGAGNVDIDRDLWVCMAEANMLGGSQLCWFCLQQCGQDSESPNKI